MTTISSAAEFALWLAHGKDRACIYATIGNLHDARMETQTLAAAAWKAAVNREVYLFQRRNGNGFDYIAIKPSKGKVPSEDAPARVR